MSGSLLYKKTPNLNLQAGKTKAPTPACLHAPPPDAHAGQQAMTAERFFTAAKFITALAGV